MDREFLIDLFSDFGPVTIRPMFSGFGISADGTNFALALRAGLYFRPTIRRSRNSRPKAQSRSSIRPAPRPSWSTPTGSCRRGCSTIPRN